MTKPKNWRTYYGSYTRPQFTAPAQRVELQTIAGGSRADGDVLHGTRADAQYVEWLMAARNWSARDALAYCRKMDKRKLISAQHFAGEPSISSPRLAKAATKRSGAATARKRVSATHVAGASESPIPAPAQPASRVTYTRRVAIYARVSKDSSDHDNQLHQLRCWALSIGGDIVGEYLDTESGGKGLDKRPELARLLTDAESGKCDVVVCWALDRLTREGVLAGLQYLQRLNACGVGFHSFTEPLIDTQSELVRDVLVAILLAMAKQERVRISERTKAGLDRVRRVGSKSGLPIGRPGLDPEKIAIIRRMTSAPDYDKHAVAAAAGVHWKTALKYAA